MIIRKIDAQEPVAAKKLRVAAYCRVSTENADQKESLEAQNTHYESWTIPASPAQRQISVTAYRIC